MKISAKSFYRQASTPGPTEDGTALNMKAQIFLACDGVSSPYSPSHPRELRNGMTDGQIATKVICDYASQVPSPRNIKNILLDCNVMVLLEHLSAGKDPIKEAVAGACIVACQVGEKQSTIILAGDCFVLIKNQFGFQFLTNFDQAAFHFEERGNLVFEECLNQAGGDKKSAWDLYFQYFSMKQFFRANKNIGKGGHAMVNGDPALEKSWTTMAVSHLSHPEWMLLGTDGLLTSDCLNPKNRNQLGQQLGNLYVHGGLPAILEWRDKNDYLPHIGTNCHPEASAIELKFGE